MTTLLQSLLLQTQEHDPVLRDYIETVVPAMEQEFGLIPALGGSEHAIYHQLDRQGKSHARETAQRYAAFSEQSLLVHVLNALLIAWNLLPHLSSILSLSESEKRLLCLGLTLHDYNKYCNGSEEEAPRAADVTAILTLCEELGEKLNFHRFWPEWRDYLSDISYLAQNTQGKIGTNLPKINWPEFGLTDDRRLCSPLTHLLGFGDVAVHLSDPSGIATETRGDRLRERLFFLDIKQQLVYHRLRDTLGLLTNGIHNAVLHFTQDLDWTPLLFFAQGVVYLAPQDSKTPEPEELQECIWQQISQFLGHKMLAGEIGFKRDGKGLKVAPQTLELFPPAQLIRGLPDVVAARVANAKNPATPKRLQALELSKADQVFLAQGADLRADRIAELIFFIQKEFLGDCPAFAPKVLELWGLNDLTPKQTQVQSGGVNRGWYHAAAHYVATHRTLDEEGIQEKIEEFVEQLVDWAEVNALLPEHHSPTREVFYSYLTQYLEVQGWQVEAQMFQEELQTYATAKTRSAKQPICSLSSGEFASEYQMDSVVLFNPQQYSNKNPLGGRQIKRGISKIWSLEMLLRQALWAVPAGKLEDQNPIFLYTFPAYVYAPQTAAAIRLLVNDLKRINLWDVRRHWIENGMDSRCLNHFPWLIEDPEAGKKATNKYSGKDLPFMATNYTRTQGKTVTDAWVEPAFIALALPMLLGVKVVATSSAVPLYASDSDFQASVKLDGPAGFWTLLGLPSSLHLQDFAEGRIQTLAQRLDRLLVIYSLHLECCSDPPDPRWRALSNTVRRIMTDVLNIFALANESLRRDSGKREPSAEEIQRFWSYAQVWAEGDLAMQEKLKVTRRLVEEYRTFYRAGFGASSHAILLPLSKALEEILSVPDSWDDEELIFQGAGQLQAALDRQEIYKRPLLLDKSIPYEERVTQELAAIQTFMSTCVEELFG
ncbi:MAG: type I-D CRISPR-associated protein Cas10d/Csc3, partial [Thermosynechococcaceae cyanobacterium]